MMTEANQPPWWHWDLKIGPHIEERMKDRRFDEIDLRKMLEDAESWWPDVVEGRWRIETRLGQVPWRVIVEPDDLERILVAVTAYPLQ